jgi:peroxiredoxin
LIGISIDNTVTVVAEFANKADYRFPILKSDGTVESLYTGGKAVGVDGTQIPQLYVFDPTGNIRFHLSSFENDGLFDQKLEWMIEVALK